MENMVFCQSCGMPLNEDVLGFEQDGSKNQDYCHYCYQKGSFTSECTMEEMVEFCIKPTLEAMPEKTEHQARKEMLAWFPTLKRWKK